MVPLLIEHDCGRSPTSTQHVQSLVFRRARRQTVQVDNVVELTLRRVLRLQPLCHTYSESWARVFVKAWMIRCVNSVNAPRRLGQLSAAS